MLWGESEKDRTLEQVMEQYSERLMRTAYVLLNNQQDAEEAVADTFMKYHVNMHNFREESSLNTYLVAILINQCRQKKRTAWYRKVFLFRGDHQVDECSGEYSEDSSSEVVNRLFVQELVEQLSIKEREVVMLFYYHDLSIQDISQLLKMKEGTVKSHLHRARKLLRELGGEEYHG